MATKTNKNKKDSSKEESNHKTPAATLLSSISYEKREDYENFLSNLTPEHSVIVLVSAANHAQSRGAFNLEEAELVAKAIKRLSQPPSTEQTNSPIEETAHEHSN